MWTIWWTDVVQENLVLACLIKVSVMNRYLILIPPFSQFIWDKCFLVYRKAKNIHLYTKCLKYSHHRWWFWNNYNVYHVQRTLVALYVQHSVGWYNFKGVGTLQPRFFFTKCCNTNRVIYIFVFYLHFTNERVKIPRGIRQQVFNVDDLLVSQTIMFTP